jgi:hypothetical protein
MVVTRSSINFHTKQTVYFRESTQPYVGYEKTDDMPDGWRYDIKRWCSPFDLRLPTLPRLSDSDMQGLPEEEYFKSGVGSVDDKDCLVQSVSELFRDHERHWIPVVMPGHYYRYSTPYYLYSDKSRVQYVDPNNNKDNRNYILLDTEPQIGSPISATIYRRHPITRSPSAYIRIKQVAKFSGTYTDGIEDTTVTPLRKILWDNVDYTKKEFIVDYTQDGYTSLRFNRDFTRSIGVDPVVFQDLAACEVVGISNGSSYQTYYLNYFPVLADDSFHLYVADATSWTEWTRVDTWFELINSTNQNRYFIDKDLGIIYLGSAAAGGIPPIGHTVVVSYKVTIRIEYEATSHKKVTSWLADTSPVSQYINQGFVCITNDQLEASNIKLEIDKPIIPFTYNPREYGPVYAGSDYAVLKAIVTTASGTVVPNTEVGFTMTPTNIGYIAGSSSIVSATNGKGEAYTSYQPPVSADNLGFYTTIVRASNHPSYPAHKDVIIRSVDAGLNGRENEIYIFQILKDDILLGYDDVDEWIYYNMTAPAWVTDAALYARWKEEVVEEYDLRDWDGVQTDGSIVGRKVVVYKIDPVTDNYDPYAVNPVTGELGAVVPVRPELVEKITSIGDPYYGLWRVIYPEDAIPDPDPDDSNNNVGGYWLASTRLVTFQAHCWSERYNRIIYSNKIIIRVSMPDYLLGEYVNDYMQKIPFGWKLPTDDDNIAAGLNGATFITINPHSGPYKIIDLIHGNTSDDWASAPFTSIGFQFHID